MLPYIWRSGLSTVRKPIEKPCSVGSARSQVDLSAKNCRIGPKAISKFKDTPTSFKALRAASPPSCSIVPSYGPVKRWYSMRPSHEKPYEKAEKCEQAFESLFSVLKSPNVDPESALEQLQAFVTSFPESGSEKQVIELIKAFFGLKFENGNTIFIRVLEVAFAYLLPLQKLSKAEEIFYKARSRLRLQGTHFLFAELLTLSGRHKLRPSIELAFKSWKKDFGLTYAHTPSPSPLDATPQLRIFGVRPNLDGSETQWLHVNFQSLQHRQEVISLFVLTIKAATKAKEIELAVQVFEEALLVAKYDDSLFEVMVESLCHMNRIENAHRLLYDMHNGRKVTFTAIHAVLRACGRLQNYFLAERLFADIKAVFHLIPSVETWNVLLEVHILRGAMEMAHDRFIQLLQSKERIRPNLATYELLIPGHVRAKDLQRASEMLKHAKSNQILISATLYAWLMEAHLHAKQYDEAFAIIDELLSTGGELPQKFQNLLLRKCRRVEGLLPRYEAVFGPAPEPLDDLKEIRHHVDAMRRFEAISKPSVANGVLSSQSPSNSVSKPDTYDLASDITSSMHTEGESIENAENFVSAETAQESQSTPDIQKQSVGVLEELVEDDAEVSMEDWMKDDLGEHGWKDFSLSAEPEISVTGKKKKSKYAHMVNLRYKDVFEAVGWSKDSTDLDGAVEVRQWQIIDDPFSRPRPEVVAKRQMLERAAAQIETLQAEVIEKIDAQTTRSKLKEQRRRERAYGHTRKYIEDPRKRKQKVRDDFAPAGSTFSFR